MRQDGHSRTTVHGGPERERGREGRGGWKERGVEREMEGEREKEREGVCRDRREIDRQQSRLSSLSKKKGVVKERRHHRESLREPQRERERERGR
jgi:hypothetical protein